MIVIATVANTTAMTDSTMIRVLGLSAVSSDGFGGVELDVVGIWVVVSWS